MMKVLYPYPVTINPPRNNWYITDLGRLWFNHGTSEWSTRKDVIKKPTIWYTTETPVELARVLDRLQSWTSDAIIPESDIQTLLQTLKAE